MAVPTEKTIKQLFARSGNICAFPGCQLPIVESSGTIIGEICHICAKSKDGPRFDPNQSEKERHSFSNLILLCRNHHKIIDSESNTYTVDALREIKQIHESVVGRSEAIEDRFFAKVLLNKHISVKNDSGNVSINSPGSIQAQTVHVRTDKKPSINAPAGTIGSDQSWSRYIQHLIKRYNEFASADPTRKTKFNYGVISRNIETKFGSSWRLLPIEKARDISEYLQSRITKTRLARINKSKGDKAFSTYEEYIEKYDL